MGSCGQNLQNKKTFIVRHHHLHDDDSVAILTKPHCFFYPVKNFYFPLQPIIVSSGHQIRLVVSCCRNLQNKKLFKQGIIICTMTIVSLSPITPLFPSLYHQIYLTALTDCSILKTLNKASRFQLLEPTKRKTLQIGHNHLHDDDDVVTTNKSHWFHYPDIKFNFHSLPIAVSSRYYLQLVGVCSRNP